MQTNTHIGRLIKPFALQHVGQKQIAMVRIGLAVKQSTTQKAPTDFIYYVAFGKTAERLYQYANQKGMPLEVKFNLQSEHYQTATGETKYRINHVIESFMPWAPMSDTNVQQSQDKGTARTAPDEPISTDEMQTLADLIPSHFNWA